MFFLKNWLFKILQKLYPYYRHLRIKYSRPGSKWMRKDNKPSIHMINWELAARMCKTDAEFARYMIDYLEKILVDYKRKFK